MEDVHRAGGIMAILGELDRGGLIHRDVPTVHTETHRRGASTHWDIAQHQQRRSVHNFFRAAPGGIPTQVAFSQDARWDELDLDREERLHPQRRARLLARTAASPCCTATSRWTAAS